MSPEAIEKLEFSFGTMLPQKDLIAETFYNRLFEKAPEVRELFKGPMEEQGEKLMMSLERITLSLRTPVELVEYLESLARRHIEYGVIDAYYPVVGEALLWTFEEVLGEDFTPELKKLWAGAYGFAADAMIAAVQPVH